MSRILAIDLGKFKSVTCLLDSDTNQTEFWTHVHGSASTCWRCSRTTIQTWW